MKSGRGSENKSKHPMWKKGERRISSIQGVLTSCEWFGGIWLSNIGRFMNTAWVKSQQLRTIETYVAHGHAWIPEKSECKKDGKRGAE